MINVFSKLGFQREETALLRETDGRSEGGDINIAEK